MTPVIYHSKQVVEHHRVRVSLQAFLKHFADSGCNKEVTETNLTSQSHSYNLKLFDRVQRSVNKRTRFLLNENATLWKLRNCATTCMPFEHMDLCLEPYTPPPFKINHLHTCVLGHDSCPLARSCIDCVTLWIWLITKQHIELDATKSNLVDIRSWGCIR